MRRLCSWNGDLYTRGLDPSETDYASFTFPSKASPYFPEKEWEEARRTLPEDVFKQEYVAEFLEDSAGVFRNLEGCLIPEFEQKYAKEAKEEWHRSVVIGCDVAKHTDWTVLIAMDAETGWCFAMERFNQLDWPIQKERIVAFARKLRGRVILDSTGIGDPILDDLKRVLPDIEGYKLTPGSKTELIQRLVVAVEQRKVSWPGGRGVSNRPESVADRAVQIARDTGPSAAFSRTARTGSPSAVAKAMADKAPSATPCGQASLTSLRPGGYGGQARSCTGAAPDPIRATVALGASRRMEGGDGVSLLGYDMACWDILTNEMKRYEYTIMPSGGISYGAPSGYHDDCVIALALANHRRWESETVGRMLRIGGGRKGIAQSRRGRGERVVVR